MSRASAILEATYQDEFEQSKKFFLIDLVYFSAGNTADTEQESFRKRQQTENTIRHVGLNQYLENIVEACHLVPNSDPLFYFVALYFRSERQAQQAVYDIAEKSPLLADLDYLVIPETSVKVTEFKSISATICVCVGTVENFDIEHSVIFRIDPRAGTVINRRVDPGDPYGGDDTGYQILQRNHRRD